jgi:hypothetical protein
MCGIETIIQERYKKWLFPQQLPDETGLQSRQPVNSRAEHPTSAVGSIKFVNAAVTVSAPRSFDGTKR